MNFGLLLAGMHTVVFRCGCLFARGDIAGVAGWRLCREHACLQPMVEEIFGGEEEPCVVTHRTSAGRPPFPACLQDGGALLALDRSR